MTCRRDGARALLFVASVSLILSLAHAGSWVDGSNVEHTSVQDAIDASVAGDTIRIDSGTYTGAGNVNLLISHSLRITTTSDDAKVVLDCKLAADCILATILDAASVAIDNLVLRRGNGNLGGGLFIRDSGVSFTGTTIEDCTAVYGGGIMAVGSTSRITMTDCVMQRNTASGGGGATQSEGVDWTIRDSLFSQNVGNKFMAHLHSSGSQSITGSRFDNSPLVFDSGCALVMHDTDMVNGYRGNAGAGGALLSQGCLTVWVENCYMANNTATYGPGFYVEGALSVNFHNNVLEKNTATTRSTIYIGTSGPTTVTMSNCILRDNTAPANSAAYFIGSAAGAATVTNVTFEGHVSSLTSPVAVEYPVNFVNCVFRNNTHTGEGGALAVIGTSVSLVDCVFEDNYSDVGGGAVTMKDSVTSLIVRGSTFRRNSGALGGVFMVLFGENTTVDVDENTLIEDNSADYGGAWYVDSNHLSVRDHGTYRKNSAVHAGGVSFFPADSYRPKSNKCEKSMTCQRNEAGYGDEYATPPLDSFFKGKTHKKSRNLDELKLTLGVYDELGNEVVDENIEFSAVVSPQDGILVDLENNNGNDGVPLITVNLAKGTVDMKVSIVGEFDQKYNVSFEPSDESLTVYSFETKIVGCDDDDEYEEFFPPGISFFSICKGNQYNDTTSTQDTLLIVYGIIAGLGILTCLVSSVVVFLFRRRFVFRYASFDFCMLILCSMMIGFATVYPALVEASDVTCNLIPVFLLLSFGLVFSALIAKVYRIWRLFSNKSMRVVSITSFDLLKFVGVGLLLELAVIVVVLAAGQPTWEYSLLDDDDGNGEAHNYVKQCTLDNATAVVAVVFTINALFLLVAMALAFATRGVATGFNDARAIGIIVYSITFICCLFIPLILIQDSHDFTLAFGCAAILLALWLIWFCLFGPLFVTLITGADKKANWSSTFRTENSRTGGSRRTMAVADGTQLNAREFSSNSAGD